MEDPNLTISVLLTLSYSDQFFYPLSIDEINHRLIKLNLLPSSSQSLILKKNIKTVLKYLTDLTIIANKGDYFYLRDSGKFLAIRQKHGHMSVAKWQEVAQAVEYLQTIPWIKAVYVTGSLAVNNVVAHDDIDFMLVVEHNRLWITRLWVMLLTAILHKRRIRKGEGQDTWCFNMWLSEKKLKIPPHQRSLYTAYELFQAKCVWDREGINQRFYSENSWAKKYLVNFIDHNSLEFSKSDVGQIKKIFEFIFSPFLYLSNLAAFASQWLYMKPHMTNEQVGLNKALFHPRNTRSWIKKRWKKSLLKILEYAAEK